MAFRPYYTKNIGTSEIPITITGTDLKSKTVIGLSLSNLTGSGILADAFVKTTNGYSVVAAQAYSVGDFVVATSTHGSSTGEIWIFECTATIGTSTPTVLTGLDFTTLDPRTTTVVDDTTGEWTAIGEDRHYIVKNIPISSGATEIIVGGDQKVVLFKDTTNNQDDILYIKSNTVDSIDAIVSYLQED